MNRLERVRAALRADPVDRVPASFWLHFPPEQAHGEASVQAHLQHFRQTGVDYMKIMNEHPYRTDVSLNAPSDWRRLRPAPLSSRFYQDQLDEIKAIVDQLQGECLVITTIFGPFASGNHASPENRAENRTPDFPRTADFPRSDLVTEHLRADPAAVSQGLSTIAESLAGFAIACVNAGASGIYLSAQGGEEGRFTEEDFLSYVKPHDLTVLDALRGHGEFHLLHICGDHIRLPLYSDYPAHAVNWAATKHNLDLKQGRDLFSGKSDRGFSSGRTVVGGMDDRGVMVHGPQEAIRSAARAVVAGFGTRGLILGADCTLPTDTPVSHIRAAVEATSI